jgi:hypothetical protein
MASTTTERGQATMKTLVAMVVIGILTVVAMAGPTLAQERAGAGRQGGEGLGAASRHHDRHGHHGHHRHHHHRRHVVHGPVIYWSHPTYVPPTTYVVPVGGYWYYCPSAQAYYPYVTNCLETWVAVPVR